MVLPPGMPDRPTTRFAPSPTGFLHLGHVANAVWTWGIAQAAGGTVVLRVEDHDRGRCRPEFETAVLDDLEWLGLEADDQSAASIRGPRPSRFRQSDNAARYQAALERLESAGTVYWCECSRKTIAAESPADPEEGERRYPGTCRTKGRGPGPRRGIRVAIRDETIRWRDLRLGPMEQTPAAQCGDLLLRDQVGNWTYHFCGVVDDLEQGIDLVVRGEDILPSTGRQILLARMLRRAVPPAYLHHPLIRAGGAKLSKRDGAESLADLRARGVTRDELLGRAAWATGLLPEPTPIGPSNLGSLFERTF